MSDIITDLSSDQHSVVGNGHPSASKRRETALLLALEEQKALVAHLKALVVLLISDREGFNATFSVESINENLGNTFNSTFDDTRKKITFFIEADGLSETPTPRQFETP